MPSPSAIRRLGCVMGWLLFFCLAVVSSPCSAAGEVPALERIRKAGVIRVCLDPDNLPYSHAKRTPHGFDVDISQRIAEALGVQAQFVWVDSVRDTPLGEVVEGQCDCAMGTAIDVNAADELANVGEKVAFTKPYYGTGYVLVVREGAAQPGKLEDLKGKKIGAEAGSVADYNLNLKHFERRLYPRQEAVFSGLRSGEIAAGFLWAPNAGWMLKSDPTLGCKRVEGYIPEKGFRWNVGVAVRKEDGDLKAALDKIIQRLVETSEAAKILASYGVPYFPPFP